MAVNLNMNEIKLIEIIYKNFKSTKRKNFQWNSYNNIVFDEVDVDGFLILMRSIEQKGYINITTNKISWSIFFDIQQRLIDYFENTKNLELESSKTNSNYFINENRIIELRNLKNEDYDLSKLIQMLEEINSNYRLGNYYSVGLLLRSVINHVPPIFDNTFTKFEHVANNYGTTATKPIFLILDQSMRKLGDYYAHELISNKETLPNNNSINYIPNFDFLLSEILKKITK